jgi:multiple PDZ domain protein
VCVCAQDSLSELNQQLQQHPSILPVDFDITPCGDLVLNVPPPVDLYDPGFGREYQNHEFDDQRVPVAKLSHSSSGDTSSPQVTFYQCCGNVDCHFQTRGWKPLT